MSKEQHKALYKLIGYIAWTCIISSIGFISYGVYKENWNVYKNEKLTAENYWQIVSWCYNVRGYCWSQYAFDLQKKLFKLWYNENNTIIIINNCKKQEKLWKIKNVGQCIRTAGMIWYTESSWWQRCYNNNCMWLYSGKKWYKDKDQMFKDWLSRYIKYWYNHPYPYEYYGANPKTGYCYGGCMNGLNNATYAYKLLNSNK